jgi:mRNA interferase RelE/StbE
VAWKIDFEPDAGKQLKKLDKYSQQLIRNYLKDKVLNLEHPKMLGKALKHSLKGCWRYRVDKFRIVCDLQENRLIVLVVKIAKRDVVYED